jgi:hypothetical protein
MTLEELIVFMLFNATLGGAPPGAQRRLHAAQVFGYTPEIDYHRENGDLFMDVIFKSNGNEIHRYSLQIRKGEIGQRLLAKLAEFQASIDLIEAEGAKLQAA